MPSILKDVFPEINVEDYVEKGYDINVINQIFKAAKKGCDITDVEVHVDGVKLRTLVNNLSSKNLYFDMLTLYEELRKDLAIPRDKKLDNLLKEINDAEKNGIDKEIFHYLNRDGSNAKRIISLNIKAKKIGVNMYDYLKKFNTGEFEQILIAKEQGLDIDKYIPTMSRCDRDRLQALNLIFKHYKDNNKELDNTFKNIIKIAPTLKVMKKIENCLENKLDISAIFKNNYNPVQVSIMTSAIRDGLDVSFLENKNLNQFQMNAIYTGLRQKIDVSLYSNEKYDENQMQIIRMLLVYNTLGSTKEIIDPTPILNYNIPSEDMLEYVKAKEENDFDKTLELLSKFSKISKPETIINIEVEKTR